MFTTDDMFVAVSLFGDAGRLPAGMTEADLAAALPGWAHDLEASLEGSLEGFDNTGCLIDDGTGHLTTYEDWLHGEWEKLLSSLEPTETPATAEGDASSAALAQSLGGDEPAPILKRTKSEAIQSLLECD